MLVRFLTLLLISVSLPVLAQGQYRSRIMVDPMGDMTKGGEISVQELEQQIDSISDPYARSSATRHLARHYVQQKDYASAIDYYRQALAADGLSDVANREMLRELAQVYLLDENYREAVTAMEQVLAIKLVPAASDFLLLAQARYRLQDYVGVVESLDGIAANGLKLELAQMRQALALYYRAGAYEQCEELLRQLLLREPAQASYWHQLASVYLQQNKHRQALDQLVLAMEKGIPFTEQELLLLIDLFAVDGNPYGAAALLQQALADSLVTRNATNYRKLFELWFQARERDRAAVALRQAAQLSGDTELYLYLAQLQMEDQAWQPMLDTVLASCENQLQDRYVSRANLYLGVSLLKLGREEAARRAFINATLVGGATAQAGEWLRFMEASPSTDDEIRKVRGPCYGSQGKKGKLEPVAPASEQLLADTVDTALSVEADTAAVVEVKTVPATRFYYSSHSESLLELLPKVRSLAIRLNVTLVKADGSADGPLHIISIPGEDLRLAFPVRGTPQSKGRYRTKRSGPFKCAWYVIEAQGEEALLELTQFVSRVEAAGYELSGERRMIIRGGSEPGFEVQLGIN